MGLFKKKTSETGCCSNASFDPATMEQAEKAKADNQSIKVLGTGCAKCNELSANTKEALACLGLDTPVDHVTDFAQIAAFGVMTTPALVVNGKVVSCGKVLKKEEIMTILQK